MECRANLHISSANRLSVSTHLYICASSSIVTRWDGTAQAPHLTAPHGLATKLNAQNNRVMKTVDMWFLAGHCHLMWYIVDIWYPWKCGQWLCLSMLVEVVTRRADDSREAEDTSMMQRWWCDVVNTALRWPTRRYINHKVRSSPGHGSFPEVIRQLGYHANPDRSTKQCGRRTSYERKQQQYFLRIRYIPTEHMISTRSTIQTAAVLMYID